MIRQDRQLKTMVRSTMVTRTTAMSMERKLVMVRTRPKRQRLRRRLLLRVSMTLLLSLPLRRTSPRRTRVLKRRSNLLIVPFYSLYRVL